MQPTHAFLAGIFAILSRHEATMDLMTASESSLALILNATGTTSGEADTLTTSLLTELSSHCRVEIETGLDLVTLVGNELSLASGACNPVFSELETHPVRMICHGASQHNLCILLPAASADDAIKALHQRLFGH